MILHKPNSIPGISYDPLYPPGVIPKCRIKSNLWAPLGMFQKQTKKKHTILCSAMFMNQYLIKWTVPRTDLKPRYVFSVLGHPHYSMKLSLKTKTLLAFFPLEELWKWNLKVIWKIHLWGLSELLIGRATIFLHILFSKSSNFSPAVNGVGAGRTR